MKKVIPIFWVSILLLLTTDCRKTPGSQQDYDVETVPFTSVNIQDEFWGPQN